MTEAPEDRAPQRETKPPKVTASENNHPAAKSPRVPIENLPPDRQAEIRGGKLAAKAKRKRIYRPQVPEIYEEIELHTSEIHEIYIGDFEACNQYAIAIDYVARERLTDRSEFNAYLQAFDDAISDLTEKLRRLHKTYEVLSNGGMSKSRNPQHLSAAVQTKRSMQILQQFQTADKIIRMIQFLHIYGELHDRRRDNDIAATTAALRKCVRALRNVKLQCFKRIIELEALSLQVKDTTTIEALQAARDLARKKASLTRGKQNTPAKPKGRTISRSKKSKPVIDPAAPASAPIGGGSVPDDSKEQDRQPSVQTTDPKATAAE